MRPRWRNLATRDYKQYSLIDGTEGNSMIGTLRRNGNSVVVTIPRDELERAGLKEGDMVEVQIRPVDIRPRLTPSLEASLKIELEHGREALEYLGSH
jgi:antitoxin component of MazEF toxin-antitoxin module